MTGDKKTTQLDRMVTPASEDLLLIIDNPNGTPVNKSITLKVLFTNVPSNTSITGTFAVSGNATFSGSNTRTVNLNNSGKIDTLGLTVSGNGVVIMNTLTPGSSNGAGITTGKMFYDSNYLYIKTANNVVKRVALDTF